MKREGTVYIEYVKYHNSPYFIHKIFISQVLYVKVLWSFPNSIPNYFTKKKKRPHIRFTVGLPDVISYLERDKEWKNVKLLAISKATLFIKVFGQE